MATGFPIPSMSETREFLVALFKALFSDRNVGSPRSYHARRITVLAGGVTQIHAHIDSAQKDLMPTTARDNGPIDDWGEINGTGARKGATPARKAAAGRVRGTAAAVALVGEELTHPASGLTFKLASQATIPGVAPLYADVDIVAVDVGAATRLTAGETLEFTNAIAGIETQVVLQKDLDEDGYDAEQFGAYRRRVLDRFKLPSAGGNQSDYVAWMLAVEGVSYGFAYPNRAGLGTVDIVALHTGSGAARVLLPAEITEVTDYVKTKAPAQIAGTGGSLRHLDVADDEQDIELRLQTNGEAAYEFDFDDSAGYTVGGYVAATRTLTWSTLPASLKAGHRVVFGAVASAQDGREYKIESITGPTTVVLEEATDVDLVATDTIYSGGPLTTPIRDAILGHVNGEAVYADRNRVPRAESDVDSTVGLEVIADGIGPANPAGIYGTWSGGLIRAVLAQIALYKAGVRNVDVVTPAADYEAEDPAFPDDDEIGLIVPGAVLVRKWNV